MSFLRDDAVIVETVRLRLQKWDTVYGMNHRDHGRGWVRCEASQCASGTISISNL